MLSVELFADFTDTARPKLARCGVTNVTLRTGDASAGWPAEGPYDCIALTGSLPELNPVIEQQLAVGGRLFAIVGQEPVMQVMLITRVGEQDWSREPLFETVLPPLLGLPPQRRFSF